MMAASLSVPRAPAGGRAGPGAVVRGYASVFRDADISGDRIEPGAFAASLRRRGAQGIRLLWQHDPAQPIGVWTSIVEDRIGLLVEGRLALDTIRGREAAALIRAGAIDGLSIGFRTRRARRQPGESGRRLVEIDLWEISIVTFPMQERARILQRREQPDLAGLAARIQASAKSLAESAL